MNTFKTNTVYKTRSICDSECIFSFEVVSRTSKTVTIKSKMDGLVKRKIFIYDNSECIMPLGSYSMAPMLKAN